MLLTAALALALSGCPPPPPPPAKHVLTAPRWIHDTLVTEYWPAPERWFTGALVRVPGIPGRHRADWLFGARGLPMEGEGLATNGRIYHFAGPYGSGWLNAAGGLTAPCTAPGHWTNGRPARLAHPSWARYAPGHSRTLVPWKSVAVDRNVIPFGSRIFMLRALLDARTRLGLRARHRRRDRRRAHRPLPAAAGATERRPRAPRTVDARRAAGHAAEAHAAVPVTDDDVLAETRAFNDVARCGARGAAVSAHAPARGDTPRAPRGTRRLPAARLRGTGAHDRDPGPRRADPAAARRAGEPTRRLPAHPRRRLDDRLGRRAGPAARGARRRQTGLTMVSVEYRLAPEHPFPGRRPTTARTRRAGCVENHTGRLAIGGESAGAHLAALDAAAAARPAGISPRRSPPRTSSSAPTT